MRLPWWAYLTESDAKDAGMTHEGYLFGVPAWLVEDSENVCSGCPKIPVLQLWCIAMDWAMEAATYLVDSDKVLVTPISIGRKL